MLKRLGKREVVKVSKLESELLSNLSRCAMSI